MTGILLQSQLLALRQLPAKARRRGALPDPRQHLSVSKVQRGRRRLGPLQREEAKPKKQTEVRHKTRMNKMNCFFGKGAWRPWNNDY